MDLFDASNDDPQAVALLSDGWATTMWRGVLHWISPEGAMFLQIEDAIRHQVEREGTR